MYSFMLNGVFVLLLVALGLSVLFSFQYRRQTDADKRGLFQARQNIAMGFMLVLLALYPLYLMPGTNLRIAVGIVFLLIGLFNLFVGVRNHSFFRTRMNK